MHSLPDPIDLPKRSTLTLLAACLTGCGGGGSSGSSTSTTDSGTGSSGSGSGTSTPLGTVAAAIAGSNQSVALRAAAVAPAVPTYSALLTGANTKGQMGNGGIQPSQSRFTRVSTAPSTGTTWKAIAAGGEHTLAIKSDGTLWAWGLNRNGQLGNKKSGNAEFEASPVQIGTLGDWVAVAAGASHSLGLSGKTPTTQKLWSWGQNTSGQLGLATLALTPNLIDKNEPTAITKSVNNRTGSPVLSAIGGNWDRIVAGGNFSAALRSTDKIIFTWGDDSAGQLGQVISANTSIPTNTFPIGGGSFGALAIAAGGEHLVAIETTGALYAWGANASGQLGTGNTVNTAAPAQVGSDSDWYAIAAGGAHTLAIKLNRTLWAWGANADGQLGINLPGVTAVNVPTRVGTGTDWVSVTAGAAHSMAIDSSGRLWVWGRNAEGQLGNGSTSGPLLTPTVVP